MQYNNLKVTANGLTDKRDYWSLCPSAVLRYELSRKHRHNVSLSYQRTVYGLPYDGISTYRVYDGANHYSMGNPYLDVPSRHMVDLRLSLFNQFDVRLSYTKEEKAHSMLKKLILTIREVHALCCATATAQIRR